jgi:aminopeptidase YwaD
MPTFTRLPSLRVLAIGFMTLTFPLVPLSVFAQASSPDITAAELQAHIKYLASDQLEGRRSGSAGNRKAAEYIIAQLTAYGIQPAGDSAGYLQPFDFVSAVKLGAGNELRVVRDNAPELTGTADVDFRPLGFSSNTTVTAPVVFVGYGLTAPDSSYDDYAGVDVTGKIVVALRYTPEGNNPHGALTPVSSFRNKARIARERGAVGLMLITGPNDDADDDLIKLAFDQAFANSGIPVISVKRAFLDPLLKPSGWTWKSLQDSIAARKKSISVAFVGATATLTTSVEKVYSRTANVVGFLPGTNSALDSQYVIVGAHFDHLGFGGEGSGSLKPDTVAIHYGADDNASGTSGLLEVAQELAAHKSTLQRSVVFVFFSGEELGTLGSAWYVNHPEYPLAKSVAMVNMDMIGRLTNKKLTVYGTGTSPQWMPLLNRLNADSTFSIVPVPDGFGPSDHAQFYGKDIPVLFFFTGTHNDYHKPSDTWDKINYPGEEQVARYVDRIVHAIVNEPARPLFARSATPPASGGGDSRGFKVTLGVVPDYGESTEGMKIGGVRPGGPAEKGGLKAGDVIVKMAGKKILNIYDYMGLLGELKPGDKVPVEVNRGGTIVSLTVELEKRK